MAKILFIEDEPQLQKVLGEFLRNQGHEVTSALNGDDGIRALKNNFPDLVLLDLVLPHTSGTEVLAQIRKEPGGEALPVIVLTNREDSDAVTQSIELGAVAYLVKTNYSLGEISAKIATVLGSHH